MGITTHKLKNYKTLSNNVVLFRQNIKNSYIRLTELDDFLKDQ